MHRTLVSPRLRVKTLLSGTSRQSAARVCALPSNASCAAWRRQGHAGRARQRIMALAASNSSDPERVRKVEMRDGSIMFRFGEEPESLDAGEVSAAEPVTVPEDAPAPEASGGTPDDAPAAAEAEETVATYDSTAPAAAAPAAEPEAGTAPDGTPAAVPQAQEDSADDALAAAADSSSTEDDAADSAPADSPSQSVDKQQLKDLKVTELKELCRENDLSGFSKMRKDELVEFLADALPGDYQI